MAGATLATTRSSGLTLIVSGGFLFAGLMFSPDLDVQSLPYKRWGWLRWIWLPYQKNVRHRSFLSHAPLIGTTLRVLYLAISIGIFSLIGIAIANEVGQTNWSWEDLSQFLQRNWQQYWLEWLMFLLGLELGALSHYLGDWLVSTYKRYQRYGMTGLRPTSKPKPRKRKARKSAIVSQRARNRW